MLGYMESTKKDVLLVKKHRSGINKVTMNIIRTTYRNNIELTNIADNKANILLSLNALMLTFLIPIVLTSLEIIMAERLYLPLITFAITCLITIILAALATRPIAMGKQSVVIDETTKKSPFFFGNIYKMKADAYLALLENTLTNPEELKNHVKLDLYFMGKGLGEKYSKIRTCYNIFIVGIILTVIATVLAIAI